MHGLPGMEHKALFHFRTAESPRRGLPERASAVQGSRKQNNGKNRRLAWAHACCKAAGVNGLNLAQHWRRVTYSRAIVRSGQIPAAQIKPGEHCHVSDGEEKALQVMRKRRKREVQSACLLNYVPDWRSACPAGNARPPVRLTGDSCRR